jgi:hypothetical protein
MDGDGRDLSAGGRPPEDEEALVGAGIDDRARREDPGGALRDGQGGAHRPRDDRGGDLLSGPQGAPQTRDITLEASEEHHVVDMVTAEIGGVPYDDETWGAKFKVMKENIEHHIEEEENEMFKQARQVFNEDELEALGEQMKLRKEQLAA